MRGLARRSILLILLVLTKLPYPRDMWEESPYPLRPYWKFATGSKIAGDCRGTTVPEKAAWEPGGAMGVTFTTGSAHRAGLLVYSPGSQRPDPVAGRGAG